MKYVDTHAHLHHIDFDEDREEVFERIRENMEFVVDIGSSLETSQKSVEYANKYDFIYATVGVHPEDIGEYDEKLEKELEILAQNPKVLAIGEIGLDYYWLTYPKDRQKEVFIRQLELARKLKKPIVIHSRDAMEDTLNILKDYPDITGIFHCYPGSVESAREITKRFYLGIGGVLTFKNAKKLVDVVTEISLDKLVLETDCPYMAPTPFRGKRNEPILVKYVAEKIAELKGINYDEVIKITTENAKKAYNLI